MRKSEPKPYPFFSAITTESETCDAIAEPAPEITPEAARAAAEPVEVLLLESRDSFPEGRAAASALRMVSRGLVEAGASVTVLLPKPGGMTQGASRGVYKGVHFEYTCGTATRSSNFLERRFHALQGWLLLWLRLIQKRFERGRKGVCVILYGEAPFLNLPVLWLSKLFGFRVVVELCEWVPSFTSATHLRRDGTPNDRVHPLKRLWSEWYCRYRVRVADGVLAISDNLQRRSATLLPQSRSQNVLLHPVLVDLTEAPTRRLASSLVTGPYILWCGEVGGYLSSIAWIMRCYGEAKQKFPDLKLVLSGPLSDALRAQLVAEIKAAGLTEDEVIVTGYISRSELWALFSGALALLAPLDNTERSRARFPWKLAEYLASGRPVITSMVGEIPRYFTDGVNALVAQPEDAVDFTAKIELAAGNPALGNRIGAAGRELALDQFHYAAYGQRLLRFLNRVAYQN